MRAEAFSKVPSSYLNHPEDSYPKLGLQSALSPRIASGTLSSVTARAIQAVIPTARLCPIYSGIFRRNSLEAMAAGAGWVEDGSESSLFQGTCWIGGGEQDGLGVSTDRLAAT